MPLLPPRLNFPSDIPNLRDDDHWFYDEVEDDSAEQQRSLRANLRPEDEASFTKRSERYAKITAFRNFERGEHAPALAVLEREAMMDDVGLGQHAAEESLAHIIPKVTIERATGWFPVTKPPEAGAGVYAVCRDSSRANLKEGPFACYEPESGWHSYAPTIQSAKAKWKPSKVLNAKPGSGLPTWHYYSIPVETV